MTDQRDHSERYGEWDAAYVLGALSPAERHEFEEHLATCPECERAVAGFAAMPGLLASVPTADAFAMLDDADASVDDGEAVDEAFPAQPPAEILPALVSRVRRTRRRRFGITLVAGLAAAAVVAFAIVVPPLASQPKPTTSTSLQQVVPSALSATVAFTTKAWGTRIDMTCVYGGPAAGSGSSGDDTWRYGLYVTDAQGHTQRVSTWTADPGTTARTTGSIDTTLNDLRRVEVRNESSGTVLLSRALN
ncbi:anti-sigma-L factor RslA [Frondihabitans sucicola]|uniref:Anti-sigma-L factor RslA n=1 Tax=Frondihabitans sucicola TaxID=1268041 RepID=A0ABM8GKM6_9MICO|nr:zf-HC2 domain-containing protein [Frondihabitans sucicola]BDZ48932.1 anti-sigma-L factor RslA [Frondihabitans sucicola]